MDRRRIVVTSGSVALMLASAEVWAGPPPPPPQRGEGGGASTSAPPAPSRAERDNKSASVPNDPLSVDQRSPDTDLTGTWTFNRGAGGGPNYISSVEDDPFFTVNPVGYYQGVTLDGGNQPPFAPTEVGGQSAVLTWTGFERMESGSRVFFQLSASVDPQVESAAGVVTVKLPRTSVTVRNNRRKLITKYFNTPVEEVRITRKGKDVIATFVMRWDATPTWSVQASTNGYQLLVFDFPDSAGDTPAPPSSAPAADDPPSPPAPPDSTPDESDASESSGGPFLPT